MHGYFNVSVRYDGHVVLRLTDGVTTDNYFSARWHHDPCGRRLKVFVFLHDVGLSHRPTYVSAGTHHLWYYKEDGARVLPSYVARTYPPTPMLGSRGGGFVFDTNALHKGEHEGNYSRTVVILEFHPHGKLSRMPKGTVLPCPSLDRYRATDVGKRGYGNWPLYPQETL